MGEILAGGEVKYHVVVRPYREEGRERFVVLAPVFGVVRIADSEDKIELLAREMISRCGSAADQFDLEIEMKPRSL